MVNLNLPAGGSKFNASPAVVDIGGGVKVVGRIASASTPQSAAPLRFSNRSTQIAPQNTDLDISQLQRQENWAQIIVDSAIEFRKVGGVARVGYARGATVLVLPGVFYCATHGRVSIGDACHYCESGGTGVVAPVESSGTPDSSVPPQDNGDA